jgi:hypothetical protein
MTTPAQSRQRIAARYGGNHLEGPLVRMTRPADSGGREFHDPPCERYRRALDSQALVKPVASAVQSGIPVVIMDSFEVGQTGELVATDNYKGGVLGRSGWPPCRGKGNIILLRYAVGQQALRLAKWFYRHAQVKYPDMKLISSTTPPRVKSYQASQNLLNRHGRDERHFLRE